MEVEIAYERSSEGLIALVSAGQARFSFRVGKHPKRTFEAQGARYWFVEEGARQHVVQMMLSEVPEEVIRTRATHSTILISHMRWEADFQEQQWRRKLVHSGLGHFPTGEPYLRWRMEGPKDELEVESEKATTYWSDGTTLHDGIVVLFRVEGLGAGWNPELLDLKCERVLLSMFRHSRGDVTSVV